MGVYAYQAVDWSVDVVTRQCSAMLPKITLGYPREIIPFIDNYATCNMHSLDKWYVIRESKTYLCASDKSGFFLFQEEQHRESTVGYSKCMVRKNSKFGKGLVSISRTYLV